MAYWNRAVAYLHAREISSTLCLRRERLCARSSRKRRRRTQVKRASPWAQSTRATDIERKRYETLWFIASHASEGPLNSLLKTRKKPEPGRPSECVSRLQRRLKRESRCRALSAKIKLLDSSRRAASENNEHACIRLHPPCFSFCRPVVFTLHILRLDIQNAECIQKIPRNDRMLRGSISIRGLSR